MLISITPPTDIKIENIQLHVIIEKSTHWTFKVFIRKKTIGNLNIMIKWQYNLPLGQMMSGVFHIKRWVVLQTLICLRFVSFTWSENRVHGGYDRFTGDAYSS
jgi:hypothetical protein